MNVFQSLPKLSINPSQSLFKFLKKHFYTTDKHLYLSHITDEWNHKFVLRTAEVISNGLFWMASFAFLVPIYRTTHGMYKWYDLVIGGISLGFFSLFISSWYKFLRQGWRQK